MKVYEDITSKENPTIAGSRLWKCWNILGTLNSLMWLEYQKYNKDWGCSDIDISDKEI